MNHLKQRFKRADIQDLYDVRKILEAAIAERAALHPAPNKT